ncbi:TPA: DUF4279 domain-containing protein [Vibrio vulnificus]|nr:DUF4279 domain-containing protein [Vibrio vulnificus]
MVQNTIYSKIETEIFLLSQRRIMVLESLLVSIFITCEDNMRVYARLSIMSESVSSKDISGQVGMSFDELWDIGDRRKLGSIVEKDNGCTIKSEVDSSSTIEDHLESLFMRTVDKEHSIRLLSDRGDVYIQVSLSIYSEDAPPLTFERKYINWISNIGASLDVDLYPFE